MEDVLMCATSYWGSFISPWSECTVLVRLETEQADREDKTVVGLELDRIEAVSEKRMMDRIRVIIHNLNHPLYNELWHM